MVLRAVVSTASLPDRFRIFQDPRRHPSAEVLVVAGADGIVPVGVVIAEVGSVLVDAGVDEGLLSGGESSDADSLGDPVSVDAPGAGVSV
ncbi:MAG: hypothetical protein F2838_00800 [Actinobacteria bacterium]|nr:hypothetical protein [Actinomycetota bacterium]MSX38863.1 hypothetical protein [Actinomycetota bacterium]